MKKSVSILLSLVLLMGVFVIPASAADVEIYRETETYYVEGVGEVTVETVTTVFDSELRSSSKTASRTVDVEVDGEVIATITLKATFGYDGSEAWVISASATKSTSGGWTYGSQNIDMDGGTATLTAKLTKLLRPSIPVEISLTCSPSGTIR